MNPAFYLLVMVSLLAVALSIAAVARYVRSRRVSREAVRRGLQFSRPDRFLLSPRVAACLPVPGAAEVGVRDVAYVSRPGGILCVMTASFTVGAMGHRRQVRRVCAAFDPGGRELTHFVMVDGTPTAGRYGEAYERMTAALGG